MYYSLRTITAVTLLVCATKPADAFLYPSHVASKRSSSSKRNLNMMIPTSEFLDQTPSCINAALDVGLPTSNDGGGNTEELLKSVAIALTLGGGLIPATVSANRQMFQALSGRKGYTNDDEEIQEDDPNNTFDPTAGKGVNPQLRRYVMDSGATGPPLPNQRFLFAADDIPLVDVIAVLGRIPDTESIVEWRNLPSATRKGTTGSNPPMWLPRNAFKVLMRQAKFVAWPDDPKTGLPVGGEALKRQELKRISKQGALMGDAALDAVFDSWAWGASIATPDKVENTLKLFKPSPNELDLDAFVSAAIRGRSQTAIAAVTFVVIQILVYGSLFIRPAINLITGN